MLLEYVVFLPLLGAIISGLSCGVISKEKAGFINSSLLVLSALFATSIFFDIFNNQSSYDIQVLEWFKVGSFTANWSLKVDPLTSVMLIVVTYVSALVHIYSIGYMSHDPHVPRFMSYLSLFTFCMLMLVTSNNLVQLFFGWEGVGLCSYLLIGFWFKKQSACNAAIKAFVVNRVGDFGFALGIFTIYMVFGSVEFSVIFENVASFEELYFNFLGVDFHAITLICVLLFIGAMGKSAQIGLHTWLPDAMEGPTPVSALIHAATMVTAGVFLVARCSPLFEYSDFALSLVTVVGAVTCLFAATIAVTQNDIKRIIAYSTCSQLGYMFFACGVSAYNAGIFHLMTHGFFKALLFLGAGSVIHALSEEQDIRNMGGLRTKIPYTHALMLIGSLALAGIYPFAGYYSKDLILEAAYASGTQVGMMAYVFGLVAAFLTAFYSWRLLILTFYGKCRASKEVQSHIHECPSSMMVALVLLGVGSIFAGYLGIYYFGMGEADLGFWNGSLFISVGHEALAEAHHVPSLVKLSPLIAGVLGISLAYYVYYFNVNIASKMAKALKPLYLLSFNKYYFDEIYDVIFVKPAQRIGQIFWTSDGKIIDGYGPDGISEASVDFAGMLSRMQSGYIYHYALSMLFGLVLFVTYYIYTHLGL